jgi:hypothetical protein
MKSTVEIDVAEYVADLVYTLIFVFHRVVPSEAVIGWLRPMVTNHDQRVNLLQEEPLYVAADFLNIDRLSPSFRNYEKNYFKFRTQILELRDEGVALNDRSLSEYIPASSWHTTIYEHPKAVNRYQEYLISAQEKNVPRHPEVPHADKLRSGRHDFYVRRVKSKQRGIGRKRRTTFVRSEKYSVDPVFMNGEY